MNSPLTKDSASVLLTVAFTAVVVGVFYFTYIPMVSRKVVVESVDRVMDSIAEDIHTVVPKVDLGTTQMPDMSEEDEEARKTNAALKNRAIRYLGTLVGVVALLVLLLWTVGRFNLLAVLGETAVGTVAVAATYFVFVSLLIRNFRAVDPNAVKKTIAESLAKSTAAPPIRRP